MALAAITDAAVQLGLPGPAVPFLLTLLASPAVCALHNALPGALLRHLAAVVLGLGMALCAYGPVGCLALTPPVLATLAVMRLAPASGVPVFVLAFGYLLYWCAARASAWCTGPPLALRTPAQADGPADSLDPAT